MLGACLQGQHRGADRLGGMSVLSARFRRVGRVQESLQGQGHINNLDCPAFIDWGIGVSILGLLES